MLVARAVRAYLASIGKRGGLASRRELTRSHARQMVAIREAKRAATEGGRSLAAAESETSKTSQAPSKSVRRSTHRSLLRQSSSGCGGRERLTMDDFGTPDVSLVFGFVISRIH